MANAMIRPCYTFGCGKPSDVQRNGKWYCSEHAPKAGKKLTKKRVRKKKLVDWHEREKLIITFRNLRDDYANRLANSLQPHQLESYYRTMLEKYNRCVTKLRKLYEWKDTR